MIINRKALMIASFLTLIAAGAGFATRAASAPAWAKDFNIDLSTFGSIMGAGFLGFGLFIFLGGLLVELFGYKKLLLVAVILHIVSAIMLLMAPSLHAGWLDADGAAIATSKVTNVLYWSVFLFAVCNGLYEAVINPLVGQIYPENQTHYLNILHAGWPGGLIVGGILAACFQNDTAWITEIPWQYALTTYSVVLIILLMIVVKESFPDTVSQGGKVSFVTLFGCFASIPFLVLIVLHGLIGYMELGIDSWQTRLMENLVENSVTILIYTSFLMFGLRFFAGPIAHRINPIGLLFVSSLLAVGGLLWLGSEITSVLVIFAAATLYAFGKAFLWPTMLAVVGERYPNSGAVAMSTLGASGMLCVGFIGAELIGVQQSIATTDYLQENKPNIYVEFKAAEDSSFPSWGKNLGFSLFEFNQLTGKKQQEAMEKEKKLGVAPQAAAKAASEAAAAAKAAAAKTPGDEDLATAAANAQEAADDAATKVKDVKPITTAYDHGSRVALTKTAAIPTAMAIGFLGLLLYFRSIGGYKVLHMDDGGDAPEDDGGGAYAAEPDGGGTYAAEDDGGGGEKAGEAEPDDEPSPD